MCLFCVNVHKIAFVYKCVNLTFHITRHINKGVCLEKIINAYDKL